MRARREKVLLPAKAAEAVDDALARVVRVKAGGRTSIRGGEILTLLRHHDIPCSIDSFGAKGWTAKLGDPAGGFYAQQGRFNTIDAAANWLFEEARRRYRRAPGMGSSR